MTNFAFIIHLLATAMMVGVIWIVQIVHYPAFEFVEEKKFRDFALFHQQKITYIVGPIMLIEFMTGLYLLPQLNLIFSASMVLLVGIWLVTFFFSVKEHNTLLSGRDEQSIKRLIKSNWLRTLLWNTRLVILTFLFLVNLNFV